MLYSKRRKNLGGGRKKRSNRKSYIYRRRHIMSGGTMHALFLAATNRTNTILANKLSGIVMRKISQLIINAISPHISGFITSDFYIAEEICIEYIKLQRELKRRNPENAHKTDDELDREEFLLSFPAYGKTTIKDDEREEFLERFEELINSGSNDDVWWKNYEKYRNIAEKIIEQNKPTKEELF